ncbi:unnamed protein product [Rotaria socialis]|uniref:Uncharacterized protein n=1 Tax=Rotaria socialis TaxID=392032 RepID=A0A818PU45_9BILA|nr:unnamed protein product [Rotaria socialis]CAF3696302.1 unnamed protein product [Rotaria socialis]CAF4111656.1 unnamed protein product [Rotaria socialis]CAF4251854.1 unnamed protein product [Rotaria socialis]CAF4396604.1 unnamed protein product [Rotaria socialis]
MAQYYVRSCLYRSSVSYMAVDVSLEFPRLCGLCDRYEVLKHVYGEENLAPKTSTIKANENRVDNNVILCRIDVLLRLR